MKRYVPAFVLSGIALASIVTAQTTEQDRRTQITRAIEHRLQAQQSIDVAADSITLTGRLLHLQGHARIVWLPDTVIRVEEIKINADVVALVGDLNASFGSSSGLGLRPRPKIDYR